MARLFDDAQSECCRRNDAVAGVPFAAVCRFKTDALGRSGGLIYLGDVSIWNQLHSLYVNSANRLCAYSNDSSSSGQAVVIPTVETGTWYHACGLWVSATDRRAFLNGADKATESTDVTPAGADRTTIGAWDYATPTYFWSGDVAEAAIYDLSAYPGATNSDKADYFEANVLPDLAIGVSPECYPTGLIAYWPLRDDDDDYADGFDLTPINTPGWADHPSVLYNLSGSLGAQSALTGSLGLVQDLAGSVGATTSVTGLLNAIEALNGIVAAQSSLTGNIVPLTIYDLAGLINAQSGLTGNIITVYKSIPPFMEKDLIDPYASGAWLQLVKIVVPGYDAVKLARNTKDVVYGEQNFEKFNLQIGEQTFSSDGSIPRVTLRVFQDVNRKVEDIINATEGALGAAVKLIRVNEKWLDIPVIALEADYDNLASESDSEWVTFTLGIPNPLTQRFPLEDYSSSMCPWTSPELFKGPRCQYPGDDPTCTGTYADCRTKENAEHWGGELGLSPSVVKDQER